MYGNVHTLYIHIHTFLNFLTAMAKENFQQLCTALHLYRAGSGLLQIFGAIFFCCLCKWQNEVDSLEAFASPGEINPCLLLPRRHSLYISYRKKRGSESGDFHRAVDRLHVSLWPYVENDPYTLSVPRGLVCVFQRPHGEKISWWELEGGKILEMSESCKSS